jgi:hypothetical protein
VRNSKKLYGGKYTRKLGCTHIEQKRTVCEQEVYTTTKQRGRDDYSDVPQEIYMHVCARKEKKKYKKQGEDIAFR